MPTAQQAASKGRRVPTTTILPPASPELVCHSQDQIVRVASEPTAIEEAEKPAGSRPASCRWQESLSRTGDRSRDTPGLGKREIAPPRGCVPRNTASPCHGVSRQQYDNRESDGDRPPRIGSAESGHSGARKACGCRSASRRGSLPAARAARTDRRFRLKISCGSLDRSWPDFEFDTLCRHRSSLSSYLALAGEHSKLGR